MTAPREIRRNVQHAANFGQGRCQYVSLSDSSQKRQHQGDFRSRGQMSHESCPLHRDSPGVCQERSSDYCGKLVKQDVKRPLEPACDLGMSAVNPTGPPTLRFHARPTREPTPASRDMQAERNHPVRFVFRKLRHGLLKRRVHLLDIDLRLRITRRGVLFCEICPAGSDLADQPVKLLNGQSRRGGEADTSRLCQG